MGRRFIALLTLFVALSGILPLAATEYAGSPPLAGSTPVIELITDYGRSEVSATAWGDAGGSAAWYFEIYDSANLLTPVATVLTPFHFDATGTQQMSVPLSVLSLGTNFHIDVHVAAYDPLTNNIMTASPWRVRSLLFASGAPGFPTILGGGGEMLPLPGTSSPVFAYSWATLVPPVVSPGAEFVLIASGPTGLIPVN